MKNSTTNICLVVHFPRPLKRWILQFKALQEVDKKYCWFRPMLNSVALKLVSRVGWGLKLRVFLGAGLSTLDLLSDVYIAYTYKLKDDLHFFKLTLVTLGTSVFLNLLIIFVQNRKLGMKRTFIEAMPVFVGLKPAVDAMRVASGASIEEGQVFNPLGEMAFVKSSEMFAEAIPAVIIQSTVILKDIIDTGQASTSAITSVLISALSAGFISATISFDMDTDPKQRNLIPEFYGYVPNNAKKRTGKVNVCCQSISLFASFLTLNFLLLCTRTYRSCLHFHGLHKRDNVTNKEFSTCYIWSGF